MIKNRDIIIFADDWGWYPSTIQYIGKILAKYNRIFWIGSLGLRKPKFHFYDMRRFIVKGIKIIFNKSIKKNPSSIILIHPPVLPFHDYKIIRRYNNYILKKTISKKVKHYDIKNPILITTTPIIPELIGKLGETSSYYICLDDFTKFDGAFKCIGNLEKELLNNVYACFAVSNSLMQSRKPASGNVFFLPQGVDTDHFQQINNKIPDKIRDIKNPIVGYFGLLASYIDLDLIVDCAKAYPDFSFVILGRYNVDISILNNLENIHYLGEVPYNNLPSYAKYFDVGIIPFKINELTIVSNPLKLLEYLALGIPVVSTKLPEVEKFKDNVFIAENNKQFIELLSEAVKDNQNDKKESRKKIAEKYSWYTITCNLSNIIENIEKSKSYNNNKRL